MPPSKICGGCVMQLNENITGLQHLGIPTLDLEATKAFYTKLGFKVVFETDFDDNGTLNHAAFLRFGNLTLETYKAPTVAGKAGAIDHLALNVQDIEKAFDEITKLGLNNTQDTIHFLPFFDKGVKFFTIEGPNHEKVEFNQYI